MRMFKDEYRRMNNAIHADEALIQRTLTSARKTPSARKPPIPLLAALVCMMALLIVPQLLRRGAPPDVTSGNPTATPSPVFSPIGHTTEFDSMTLRYLSSYSANGSAYILLSLQGEAVTENMSLTFALTSEKTGQTFWVGAGQIDHDAVHHLSTFLLEFHEEDLESYTPIELADSYWRFPSQAWGASDLSPLPDDDRLTLTLLAYRHLLSQPLSDTLPLSDLPTDAATVVRTVDDVLIMPADDPYWNTTTPEAHNALTQMSYPPAYYTGKTVLAEGASCLPYPNFSVTAAFDGNYLRVQTATSDRVTTTRTSATTFGAWIFLVPGEMPDDPWSTQLVEGVYTPAAQYLWSDAEAGMQYRDYRFDVARNTLLSPHSKGWQLYIMGMRTTTLAEMNTRLTFTLGEASVPAAVAFQPTTDEQAQYEYTILADGTIRLDQYIGSATTVQLPLTLHGRTVSDFSRAYQSAPIDRLIIPEGVTEIPHSALLGSSVCTVTLPSSLRVIRSYAFSGCQNLTHIELPEGLEAIVDCAFASSGLEEVTLPSTLTHIGDQAFAMTALRRVVIPAGVTRIGMYAFATNRQLEYVVIPESVVFIDETAFTATPNLNLVVTPGSNAERFAIDHGIPYVHELP